MTIETIKDLIEILPSIFIYVVPGYLMLRIISYRFSRDVNKDNHILLKSIVISYILIIVIDFLIWISTIIINRFVNLEKTNFVVNLNIETLIGKVVVLVSAVIFGYLWCKLITSKTSYKLLGKLGINKSLNTSIFDDIVDMDRGLWVMVYLQNEKIIYFGALQRYEERKDVENYFLVLSNYKSFGYDGTEIEDERRNPLKWVMISTKDISRLELIYDEDSKMIEESKKVSMLIRDEEKVE